MNKNNFLFVGLLIGILSTLLVLKLTGNLNSSSPKTYLPQREITNSNSKIHQSQSETKPKHESIPSYVTETLNYILQNHKAPEGYVGGKVFQNREKRLPQRSTQGEKIRYQEWDVHPKKDHQNRGTERIITGDDQSAYFTKDHYQTFISLK